ncbi:MAG: hypothetical protein K0U68_14290 [Gammaproteobacteria bacterium]|nr:hypothetical protein [Gammaproteobacteria bacterium]
MEILIALLVVSVSLLGHAGLTSMAVDSTQTANIHGIAAYQASGISTLIRCNPGYWKNIKDDLSFKFKLGNNNGVVQLTNLGDQSYDSLLASNKICTSSICTPEQQAAFDLRAWGKNHIDNFPEGIVSIEKIAGARPLFQISMSWTEKQMSAVGVDNSSADNLNKTYQIRIEA